MMKHYLKKNRSNTLWLWCGGLLVGCGLTVLVMNNVVYADWRQEQQPEIQTVTEYVYIETPVEVERKLTDEELLEDRREKREYAHALELLAKCVMSEAGNQSLEVKRLVVDVVLNRVDHPDFPDSINSVIYQRTRGTWQFSVVGSGAINTAVPDDDCYTAIEMELQERSNDYVLYFDSSGFLPYGAPFAQVGGLYFSGN